MLVALLGDTHESLRVDEATEGKVRAWFDLFSSYRDQYRVLDCNIWNLDWGKPRRRTKMRVSQTRE